jgi:molybdopterin-guanine dinucleotide biosynthesis protein A
MGADKFSLPWRGATLGEFVARQVKRAAGNVTFVGGAVPEGARRIPDLFPGFGPVGGVVTALEDSREEWSLIVACDMPQITAEWLVHLLEAAEPPLAISITKGERLHPLCAAWHRTALRPMRRAVEKGIHTMREAIGQMPYQTVAAPEPALLANANTPEEWARLTGTIVEAGE